VLRFELFKELLFQEFFLSVTPESKLISPNLPEGDSFQTFMEVNPVEDQAHSLVVVLEAFRCQASSVGAPPGK